MKLKRLGWKWIYWFTLALAVIVVYKTFDNLSGIFSWIGTIIAVLTPFVYGVVIAFIMYMPAKKLKDFLEKHAKLSAKGAGYISISVVYLVGLGLIALALNIFIPRLVQGIVDFINSVPKLLNTAVDFAQEHISDDVISWLDLEKKIQQINVNDVLKSVSLVGNSLANVIVEVSAWLIKFIMGIVISVYILLRHKSIFRVSKNIASLGMKPNTVNRIQKYGNEIGHIFYGFLYGQIVDGIIFASVALVAMMIIGTPYASTMALIMFFAQLIPYFGATVGIILVSLITLVSGGWVTALITLGMLIVLQQIDGNIINPKIVGDSVGLNPLLVIFAVTLGGGLFGFMGVLLGVPILASVRLILLDIYENLKAKKALEDVP